MTEPVNVGPKHPAWAAIHDDDWNGATFVNWVRTLEGLEVKLCPAADCDPKTVQDVKECVAKFAKSVMVGVVHILKHGQTLCRKPGLPGDWEDADMWVGFQDMEEIPNVSCPKCLQEQVHGSRTPT